MQPEPTFQPDNLPRREKMRRGFVADGTGLTLKNGFGLQSQSAHTYRITATLPPKGDSQQYRIRNDAENYERVARQDSLEPVSMSPAGPGVALFEGTFGSGEVTEMQQSPDQKSRSREKAGPQSEGPRKDERPLG